MAVIHILITIVAIPEEYAPFASGEEAVTGSQSMTFIASALPIDYANPDSAA